MAQLGGHAINLPVMDSQLGRGESLADTARVVSGYADAIMFRTFSDERIVELAKHASVPVINGLTDGGHPVQLLADLFTIEERLGAVKGKKIAFVGDGATNMGLSWARAASIYDFELRFASPEGYQPPPELVKKSDGHVSLRKTPKDAVAGCEVVVTDVWTSMGQEAEMAARKAAFKGYCVDTALMKQAKSGAIVLHCLPAHRGEEISADVLDGPQSAVWDEAENRLHVQKALLEMLVLGHEKAQAEAEKGSAKAT
jgi:ornithine carbamoyltransferase